MPEVEGPIAIVRYKKIETPPKESKPTPVQGKEKTTENTITNFVKNNWLLLGIGAGVLYLILKR